LAIERRETVSVVRAPSAVAATMASPSLSASSRTVVPSARVTEEDDGKHGSSPAPAAGGDSDGGGGDGGGVRQPPPVIMMSPEVVVTAPNISDRVVVTPCSFVLEYAPVQNEEEEGHPLAVIVEACLPGRANTL